MTTSEYKVTYDSRKKKKESKPKFHSQLTLDEYDALTFKFLDEGAKEERGNMLKELRRKKSALEEFHLATSVDSELNKNLAGAIEGFGMAIQFIETLAPFEDNVGCPECGVI